MARDAIAKLKGAERTALECGPDEGLRNVDIGKALGIYAGHVDHVGHISRTILAMLESEGVVEQTGEDKLWKLKRYPS